jgi:hypothetical protein
MGIGFRPETVEQDLILPEEKELELPTGFGLSLRQMAALGITNDSMVPRTEPDPVSLSPCDGFLIMILEVTQSV